MSTPDTRRSVEIERTATGEYVARNVRGGEIRVDTLGSTDFTPVELLLVALGACSGADVDVPTSRNAEPTSFTVHVEADKVQEDGANILRNIAMTFRVTFPDGPDGDRARQILPRAAQASHDRHCTVSRTVETGVPVRVEVAEV